MDDWMIIALAVALLARRGGRATEKTQPALVGMVWPMEVLSSGDRPVITQEYRGAQDPSPHLGVDLMYRDASGRAYVPDDASVVAAADGVVWSAARAPRGWTVVIDHGKPYATFYTHMSSVNVAKGQRIAAGGKIGVVGADPLDAARVTHLHFAVWRGGAGDAAAVDPAPLLRSARLR